MDAYRNGYRENYIQFATATVPRLESPIPNSMRHLLRIAILLYTFLVHHTTRFLLLFGYFVSIMYVYCVFFTYYFFSAFLLTVLMDAPIVC